MSFKLKKAKKEKLSAKNFKLKPNPKKGDAGFGFLVRDIVPPEKLKNVSRIVFGWQKSSSLKWRLFAFSWRIGLVLIVFLWLITGISPLEFFYRTIWAEKTRLATIEFYPSLAQGNWQSPAQAQGAPDAKEEQGKHNYNQANSALYLAGNKELILSNFLPAASGHTKPATSTNKIFAPIIPTKQPPSPSRFSASSSQALRASTSQEAANSAFATTSTTTLKQALPAKASTTIISSTTKELFLSQPASNTKPFIEPTFLPSNSFNKAQEKKGGFNQDSQLDNREEPALLKDKQNKQKANNCPSGSSSPATTSPVSYWWRQTKNAFSASLAQAQTVEIKNNNLDQAYTSQYGKFLGAKIKLSWQAVKNKDFHFQPPKQAVLASTTNKTATNSLATSSLLFEKAGAQDSNLNLNKNLYQPAIGGTTTIKNKQTVNGLNGFTASSTNKKNNLSSTTRGIKILDQPAHKQTTASTSSWWEKVKSWLWPFSNKAKAQTTASTSGQFFNLQAASSSLQQKPLTQPLFSLWYSFDGQFWQKINNFYFNSQTGYLSLPAPFLDNWSKLANLQLKVIGEQSDSQYIVYLDSVWLEVQYELKIEEVKDKNNDVLFVDGRLIKFVYTDNNEDENLIIKTSQRVYTGLSHSEVYFSITNTTNRSEQVSIQAHFPSTKGQVEKIELLAQNIPGLMTVSKYGTSTVFCPEGWQKRIKTAGNEQVVFYECSSTDSKTHCDSLSADGQECQQNNVIIGKEQKIRYKNKWQAIPWQRKPLPDKRNFLQKLFRLGPKRKNLPAQFQAKASTASKGYIIMPGQTQYFRMTIQFPIASEGEFFIEAIGDHSGYGLLDPWWNSSWSYRLPITIDNSNNANTLTDYQIYVEIASTTTSFWQHVKSDGGDIRFLAADHSTELNYWLQYWDYTASSAAIWVQVNEIPATSTTKIYMYYGNASATTTSNMYDTFTYATTTPIYYVVNNDLSSASVKVVSLVDNNVVQLDNGTAVSLDRQGITTFTTFSATSVIKAKGPIHAKIADNDNADALVPIGFASREFTVPSSRGSESFYLYSPFATATVDLYDAGTKITAQTKTIGPSQATTTAYNIGTMAILEATAPVLLSFENDNPGDALVSYPITDRDLYGVRSNSNYIGIASGTTNFTIYCSGGASTTVTNQARGTNYSNTTCASGAEGTGDAVRLADINKVSLGAIQQADSDGYESTTYLPAKEFSTEYMVPTDAAYLAVVCAPQLGTVNLSVYDENNSFVTSGTCSPSGELPGKAYFGTGDTATYLAGSRIIATNGVPFYVYYEDITAPGAASGGDENNLFGAVQFRKFAYPAPSFSLGSEEPLAPPSGSFVSAEQKNDGSGRVDIAISVADGSHDDCKAKIEFATGTACNFSSSGDPTLDEASSSISADYGQPIIDNNAAYQVGTTSGWITTLYGTNTVSFDWLSVADLPDVDGTYCLRLTVNDGIFDQATSATTTLIVDNVAPTAPGDLSFVSKTGASVTLGFGATSTESHWREYKIYYKVSDGSAPTENDNVWASSSDANLADQNFNGAATTTITGLSQGVTYSFAIWAYDTYGNRASSSWLNITANDEPTGSFLSASQKTDGSGRVDISIQVDDANNDDTNRAKIEFATGTACNFSSAGDPTLDEASANISATYGTPVIDNNSAYQVGTTSGWIITSPGANTVNFDWLSAADLPAADGTYCLRLTVNDGFDDQLTPATTTLTLDNVAPTAPGSLTEGGTTLTSITLLFATATPATDTNEPTTNAYRIFYKVGTSSVTETDSEHDDTALNAYDYNGATSTTVTGLNANTWYVFNIWAYDAYGNKASATEIAIKTKASLANESLTFVNPLTAGTSTNIAVADGVTEWIFRAVVTETNGWYAIASTTLRLADASDNSSPFNDLEFYWDQTADQFYDISNDALGAVSLSDTSSSTCAGNTCTLDFRLVFNKNFTNPAINYTAELYSVNDSGTVDEDTYNNFYQVRFPYLQQIHYRWRNDDGGE